MSYDPGSDRVVFALETPGRAIACYRDRKTVSELTASGEWIGFPAHRGDPVPGFVTEVSIPDFGDGGRQVLYSPGLREPSADRDDPEPQS